jgi:hypothetical protein
VLSILIDSGGSHPFLNASMLDRVHCVATAAAYMKVKVENGQVVLSDREVQGFFSSGSKGIFSNRMWEFWNWLPMI